MQRPEGQNLTIRAIPDKANIESDAVASHSRKKAVALRGELIQELLLTSIFTPSFSFAGVPSSPAADKWETLLFLGIPTSCKTVSFLKCSMSEY